MSKVPPTPGGHSINLVPFTSYRHPQDDAYFVLPYLTNISFIDRHPRNAELSNEITLSGMTMEPNDVQPSKAPLLILFNPSESTTFFRFG